MSQYVSLNSTYSCVHLPNACITCVHHSKLRCYCFDWNVSVWQSKGDILWHHIYRAVVWGTPILPLILGDILDIARISVWLRQELIPEWIFQWLSVLKFSFWCLSLRLGRKDGVVDQAWGLWLPLLPWGLLNFFRTRITARWRCLSPLRHSRGLRWD